MKWPDYQIDTQA